MEGAGTARLRTEPDLDEAEFYRVAHNARQAALFDRAADEFLRPIPEDVVARTRLIVLAAALRPGQHILDVGTGTGVLIPYIVEGQPGRVVACDLSEEMLSRARDRHDNVTFIRADVADLPPQIGHFDRVICNAMFANVYDQQRCLLAIRRLMCSGGRVVISHPMGRIFVERLRASNPDMVRHTLPDRARLWKMAAVAGMRLLDFVDESSLYIALLGVQ